MPKKTLQPQKKKFPVLPVLLIAAALALIFTVGGFSIAAAQEQHDPFCTSCHTQPESTFFQRSTAAQPTDMASFHTTKKVNCIDCHSGSGITGRISAEMLGAHNALLYFTGTAVQPAKLTTPIADENCLKCHQAVTSQTSRNNHFHGFLARWQAADPNAATCISCHGGHTTDGTAQTRFQNQKQVQVVCNNCHQGFGGGD